MNDLFVDGLVEAFHVRNLQRSHSLDRRTQRFISTTVPSQGPSRGPQDPQNLCSIKPLPFTMLTKAHRAPRFAPVPRYAETPPAIINSSFG